MRLWSVHPRYFDRQALTACWREALLAQAVLVGNTQGYGHHPQLLRFRDQPSPPDSIGAFLEAIVDEADARCYAFNRTKILRPQQSVEQIPVTVDQLSYEWQQDAVTFFQAFDGTRPVRSFLMATAAIEP